MRRVVSAIYRYPVSCAPDNNGPNPKNARAPSDCEGDASEISPHLWHARHSNFPASLMLRFCLEARIMFLCRKVSRSWRRPGQMRAYVAYVSELRRRALRKVNEMIRSNSMFCRASWKTASHLDVQLMRPRPANVQRRLQFLSGGLRFGAPLAILLDHVLRRLRHELLIGESRVDLRDLLLQLADLLSKGARARRRGR